MRRVRLPWELSGRCEKPGPCKSETVPGWLHGGDPGHAWEARAGFMEERCDKESNRQRRLNRRCQGGTSKEKVPGVSRKFKKAFWFRGITGRRRVAECLRQKFNFNVKSNG